MDLPLKPPLKPMLAATADSIPQHMAYEPKWDGFRALIFRDHEEVRIFSRSGNELSAYFPDVIVAVKEQSPARCVLDGELVVIDGNGLKFTRLLERSGSAPYKISKLVASRPASVIVFDLLALDDRSLLDQPYAVRRELLEHVLADAEPPICLSPMTTDIEVAEQWFDEFEGNGLDGVMAKPLDGRYHPGLRSMWKIKHRRDADVVLGGFRLHKNSSPSRPLLGVMHLGVYDERGRLNWVGACSGLGFTLREQLLEVLLPLALSPGTPQWDAHPWTGPLTPDSPRRPTPGPRSGGPDEDTYLLEPELVCEVVYDHLEDDRRFRSNAAFVGFRPDKLPRECTFEALGVRTSVDLRSILGPL
ncbi:ATP-dependent DNA ligase [Naumannella halotolerans]|uniref:DNA ligase (ATP) n=1 Tax=Naumannella halotolerans TaxID=993414 RepID=A0A4R7J9K2_9ACTN|nr:ATP-dependent DNA ligase [Naumannella halotolerans]TDT33277.1 ATP-dependent DNA ligase [Naumannella halotolerans]